MLDCQTCNPTIPARVKTSETVFTSLKFAIPIPIRASSVAGRFAAEQFLVQLDFPLGSALVVVLTGLTFAIVSCYALLVRRVFRVHV